MNLDMNAIRKFRLTVGAVALCFCFYSSGGQAHEPQGGPDAIVGQAAVDVAHCMSTVYEVGLAVSARALGGNPEKFELALLAYDEQGRASFEDAAGDLAALEVPRQESDLAKDQERFRLLLSEAYAWDGNSEGAVALIEASRKLGQDLEAVCTELRLLEDGALASAR
jgi:hypothetical protein